MTLNEPRFCCKKKFLLKRWISRRLNTTMCNISIWCMHIIQKRYPKWRYPMFLKWTFFFLSTPWYIVLIRNEKLQGIAYGKRCQRSQNWKLLRSCFIGSCRFGVSKRLSLSISLAVNCVYNFIRVWLACSIEVNSEDHFRWRLFARFSTAFAP